MENWPLPPFFRDGRTGAEAMPLDVIAFCLGRPAMTGSIERFLPDEGVVRIAPDRGAAAVPIPLLELKSLNLITPIPLATDSGLLSLYRDAGGGEIAVPAHRPFIVTFIDGETVSGRTRGFVNNGLGLYLYFLTRQRGVVRVFIPATAIKQFRIGAFLGETVAALGLAPLSAIERALERQSRMRQPRLGERLVEARIIGPEALKTALDQQHGMPQIRLGEVLVAQGMVSRQQLIEALARMRHDRHARLGSILVEMGVITSAGLSAAIAEQVGMPVVTLKGISIATAALELVPEAFAREHCVLPLLATDKLLAVAVENPLEAGYLEELRFSVQRQIVPFIADVEELAARIGSEYAQRGAAVGAANIEEEVEELGRQLALQATAAGAGAEGNVVSETDTTLVRMVNRMILDAHKRGASDIHVEAYPDGQPTRIRFRVDGSLMKYLELPSSLRSAMVSRLKIMANMDISDHRKPQDGKIDFARFSPLKLELRVASLPTVNNLEDVVMRLLSSSKPIPLDKLGVSAALEEQLKGMAHRNYGLILVCGPTGSGKTTTLHSLLAEVNTVENKVWTAEDPIEITHPGLRQIQMNPRAGLTFATAMRAFLRADPDIIMVGEMRDEETTKIAIEASLTGHLVLSTLHTNSAPESVVRLLDMGVDPFNFADALIGVLSQRLARRLCTECRQPYAASDEEIGQLVQTYCQDTDLAADTVREQWRLRYTDGTQQGFRLYRAPGCANCHNSGYRGRVGLYELMTASPAVKKLIQSRATVEAIFAQAGREGMLRLKQYGVLAVLAGDADLRSVRSACA